MTDRCSYMSSKQLWVDGLKRERKNDLKMIIRRKKEDSYFTSRLSGFFRGYLRKSSHSEKFTGKTVFREGLGFILE